MPRALVVLLSIGLIATLLIGSDTDAEAAETGTEWISPFTPSTGATRLHDGRILGQAYLKGVSDNGSTVLQFGSLGLEVSVLGRPDNYRLADLLGGQSQEGFAALSGDGRFVATIQPRYDTANRYLGFDVMMWEPEAGVYRALLEVREPRGILTDIWISTTGRYVFYYHPVSSSEFALTRIDTATGSSRVVGFPYGSPDPDYVAVSGNGRYVFYIARGPDGHQARRLDVSTGTEVVVAGLVGWPQRQRISDTVAISPSGRFATYNGVWHDIENGGSVQFTGERLAGAQLRTGASINDEGVVAWVTKWPFSSHDINTFDDVYAWTPGWPEPRLVSISDLGTLLEKASNEVLLAGGGGIAVFGSGAAAGNLVRGASYPGALYSRDLKRGEPEDVGIVDAALRPGGGYWMVNRAGVVWGSRGARALPLAETSHSRPVLAAGEEVTSISATASGDGYWLFTSRGRVLAAGDAGHYGDLLDLELRGPIVDSVATPTGAGYYMVGADGGVFALGDAYYRGSVPEVLGTTPLAAPVVAIAVTPSNLGYRMVASDGGVFNFGDARYHGSVPEVLPGVPLAGPVIGLVSASKGYLNVATDGGIFNFGESPFHGSLGATPPPVEVSAVMVLDELSGHSRTGYVMIDRNGNAYGFGSGADLTG